MAGVPTQVGWGEALRLIQRLRRDPSSALAAAMEGWDYPISREAIIAMDAYDLAFLATGAKKPTKYPRPWATESEKRHRGNAAGRTPEQVKAMLREQFGQPEAPV